MRVLVLIDNNSKNKKLKSYAKALSKGLQENGHIVEESGTKFAFYDYICIGCDTDNVWGTKISDDFKRRLESFGSLNNQRCFAFVPKSFRASKKLLTVMKFMESLGMYIKNSDIIANESQARLIGKKLHIGSN